MLAGTGTQAQDLEVRSDFNRRSVWQPWLHVFFSRKQSPGSQQSLFGEQGSGRPSRSGLLQNASAAGARDTMLQQLWPVSISGKADHGIDHERDRRQLASDLRLWAECAGVVLRR